ncbi:MAG TPA: DMT family transporter [Solirubrobacterales bacterium]
MSRRHWTLLLALAAIWGASYMFIKIGVRDLSPAVVAWARIALAALVLVPVAVARGQFSRNGVSVWLLTLLGLVQAGGPFVLIAAGEEDVSSSLAGILVASTPLFTALLAIWIDHEERSEGLRLVGVLLGLVGVAVLLGLDLGGSGAELLGGAMIVLASLGYAIGGFIVKHRAARMAPTGVAAWVMLTSTIALLPVAIAGAPAEAPGIGPVAAVTVLGVVGTGIAFAIFYELMTTVGPARTFIVTYLAPAFAVAYGVALLDEGLTAFTIAGLVLIVGGSYLAAEGRLPGRGSGPDDAPRANEAPASETDLPVQTAGAGREASG